MKKTFTLIAFAAFFAACNTSPKESSGNGSAQVLGESINNNPLTADKAQTIEMNGLSDTIVASDGSQFVRLNPRAVTQTIVREKTPRVRTRTIVYHEPARTHTSAPAPVASAPAPAPLPSPTSAGSGTANSTIDNNAGTDAPVAQVPAEIAKKKGWSKAAKGAVIGAGAGAVAGAVISKKKGTGAIIGGIIGAGGGYVLGRVMDKKDGRY